MVLACCGITGASMHSVSQVIEQDFSARRARFAGVPAIGVGSTGGGVEIDLVDARPLEWVEFRARPAICMELV